MDEKWAADAGAVSLPAKKRSKAGWIILGLAAALLVGGMAGFGIYANGYDGVFPGVSIGGHPLSGASRQELEAFLASDELLSGEVTVTAGGETLGQYTQQELGAYIDQDALARAAWDVGREEGALGWLKNGWVMLKGMLGGETSPKMVIYYHDDVLRQTAAELASAFDQPQVDGSYRLAEDGLYATKAAEGRQVDQPALIRALTNLDGAAGSVEAPWEPIPAQELDLEALARELNAEPSPARYDIELGKVVDGQIGVSLDPQTAAFALEAAAPGETIRLPAEVTYPAITAQELEAVLFRDVLGTASTKLSGTAARRNNVRLSGECCNGVILNDGDIFDYNAVVGKRTTERGFGAASAYVNGETVDTIGGGICQTSSTIYYATLLANLEIVERYAHRYTPSYIPWGMDATVSWGGPEFRFKNDTGYPIRLDVRCEDNRITVDVVGTKTDDTYVKMTASVLDTTEYETEYVETEELDWGVQEQKQSPYTGHRVVSYRNVYSGDGKLLSSTLEAKSNYKSRNEIILVGTRGKPAMGVTMPEFGGGSGDVGIDDTPATLPEGWEEEPSLPPSDGSPGMSIFG